VERCNPAVLKLMEVIKNNWLGQVIHFSTTRVGGYPEDVAPGNNVLLDLAVHDLDILSQILGPLDIKGCICHSSLKKNLYDTAEILLANSKGISASVHVNWITPTKIRTIRVTGTKGVCFVDYIKQSCILYGGELLSKTQAPTKDFDFKQLSMAYRNKNEIHFGVHKYEPLKVQLEEFYKALTGENHILSGALQAARMVELAQKAIQTSQIGLQSQVKEEKIKRSFQESSLS